jgi:hypothetical protein
LFPRIAADRRAFDVRRPATKGIGHKNTKKGTNAAVFFGVLCGQPLLSAPIDTINPLTQIAA